MAKSVELEKKLTIDMLSEKYSYVAQLIGVEGFILLTKELGGVMFYIPKFDTILKDIRNANIKQEFNGSNIKQLSKDYNISEKWVRNIINNR